MEAGPSRPRVKRDDLLPAPRRDHLYISLGECGSRRSCGTRGVPASEFQECVQRARAARAAGRRSRSRGRLHNLQSGAPAGRRRTSGPGERIRSSLARSAGALRRSCRPRTGASQANRPHATAGRFADTSDIRRQTARHDCCHPGFRACAFTNRNTAYYKSELLQLRRLWRRGAPRAEPLRSCSMGWRRPVRRCRTPSRDRPTF